MSDYRKVFDVLVGILVKAGYDLAGKSLNQKDVLDALSDYEGKRDAMMEHLLLDKSR